MKKTSSAFQNYNYYRTLNFPNIDDFSCSIYVSEMTVITMEKKNL